MSNSNIRNDFYNKLVTIKPNVFYGVAQKMDVWDYIVFMREDTEFSENRRSKSKGIAVAVVNENFVPEDMDETIINAVTQIPGVKLSGDVEFEYVKKPDTDVAVEIMVLHFSKSSKR